MDERVVAQHVRRSRSRSKPARPTGGAPAAAALPAALRRLAQGHALAPVKWAAGEAGPAWFCGCKQTGSEPLCDGTHKAL